MNPEIYDELRKKKKLEEKGPSLIIFIFFVTFLRFPFVCYQNDWRDGA